MRTGKICFLLDPDKSEVENVFNACVRLQELFDKKFLSSLIEYWVGGTKASGDDIRKWLKMLKKKNFGKRFIYPSKISHLLGYPYANSILVPYLLNWTNFKVFIHNLLGIAISKFLKRRQLFGYLIMSDKSSAGKLVGAKNISNKEAIEIVNKFLNGNGKKTVYIEAGSGARKPVDLKLVKEVSKIVHTYPTGNFIVGGGIKTAIEVKKLFSIWVDKVVIGTALEKENEEKSLATMEEIIKPFEILWKNNLIK